MYLTQGQFVVVGGFTLYPIRVLEVIALIRVFVRSELPFKNLNRLDGVLAFLYLFTATIFLMRSDEGIAYQIGAGVDAIFLYTVFRSLIRDVEDLRWLLRGFVLMLVPYTYLVWLESLSFQNSFASLGGVELIRAGDLWIREGRLRATGSFGHPVLMGSVGGSFLPLYISLWFSRPSDKLTALLGILLCVGLVGASNSGGPMICLLAALVGWLVWPLRQSMHLVRRGMVVALIALAMVMNAPIWYVLARLSDVTGGDGYHRAVLLDIGFQNIDKWWLAGMPVLETSTWLPYTNTNTGAVDMTNNFLNFGVTAGVGAMLLLIALLTVAFSLLGRTMAAIRCEPQSDRNVEPLYWGLGVMLTVHTFNWFGIVYWDQMNAMWFLHLALIGSLCGATCGMQADRLPDMPDVARIHPQTTIDGASAD